MDRKKPPRLLFFFGWIAVIAVSVAFFIFGWRDIQLTCRRPSPGAPPTCQVSETFALGLYTRQVTAEQATGVSFQIRQSGSATESGGSPVSTVILATRGGETPGSQESGLNRDAKRELIGKMQEFLDTPNSLEFSHHARMHSLFGYLGVVGLAGLAFLLPAVAWFKLRRRQGGTTVPGDA